MRKVSRFSAHGINPESLSLFSLPDRSEMILLGESSHTVEIPKALLGTRCRHSDMTSTRVNFKRLLWKNERRGIWILSSDQPAADPA